LRQDSVRAREHCTGDKKESRESLRKLCSQKCFHLFHGKIASSLDNQSNGCGWVERAVGPCHADDEGLGLRGLASESSVTRHQSKCRSEGQEKNRLTSGQESAVFPFARYQTQAEEN
jgi:hypothetical protein